MRMATRNRSYPEVSLAEYWLDCQEDQTANGTGERWKKTNKRTFQHCTTHTTRTHTLDRPATARRQTSQESCNRNGDYPPHSHTLGSFLVMVRAPAPSRGPPQCSSGMYLVHSHKHATMCTCRPLVQVRFGGIFLFPYQKGHLRYVAGRPSFLDQASSLPNVDDRN